MPVVLFWVHAESYNYATLLYINETKADIMWGRGEIEQLLLWEATDKKKYLWHFIALSSERKWLQSTTRNSMVLW